LCCLSRISYQKSEKSAPKKLILIYWIFWYIYPVFQRQASFKNLEHFLVPSISSSSFSEMLIGIRLQEPFDTAEKTDCLNLPHDLVRNVG